MAASDDPKELFGLRIAHAGINAKDPADAERIAKALGTLLGLGTKDVGPSWFVDTAVEIMKQNGRGTNGHIGFHVDDLPAAEEWFKAHGAEFDETSRNVLPDGRTRLIYFKGEIGGFAIHLTIDD
jgi:catechol 2,3-dioxygenase-like lactoylglutathione lyase family enzyme